MAVRVQKLAKVGYCIAVLATGLAALSSLASTVFLLGVWPFRRPSLDPKLKADC